MFYFKRITLLTLSSYSLRLPKNENKYNNTNVSIPGNLHSNHTCTQAHEHTCSNPVVSDHMSG